jgi:hypothetical protein
MHSNRAPGFAGADGVAGFAGADGAAGCSPGSAGVPPIAPPETTISTRRFCWRPFAVSFEAMGLVLPNPFEVIESAEMPCEIR